MMTTDDPYGPRLKAQHKELIKRDFVESTLSLAESFANQARRALERGDQEAADYAKKHFEVFCQQALDMIQRLQNHEEAAAFAARLRAIGQGIDTRCVA